MGKGSSRPPAPDYAAMYRAQAAAAEAEKQRVQGVRNADAERFLSSNAITDEWRQGIFDQSNLARDAQAGTLDQQLTGALQDIRQRNAARGLAGSSSGEGILGQARGFADSSRTDIFDSARRRAEDWITDQQRFLNNAASDIRAGREFESAQAGFRADMNDANNRFEANLTGAKSGDQRNAAFRNFESNRRLAAAKFQESVNQCGQQGTLAAALGTAPKTSDEESAGQVGGGFSPTLT